MPDINVAYNWEVSMCNAPNIGYSQAYRQGQTVNGITYYDCSSFQSAALTAAGFFDTNPWFTTFSMGRLVTRRYPGTQQCIRQSHRDGIQRSAHNGGKGEQLPS